MQPSPNKPIIHERCCKLELNQKPLPFCATWLNYPALGRTLAGMTGSSGPCCCPLSPGMKITHLDSPRAKSEHQSTGFTECPSLSHHYERGKNHKPDRHKWTSSVFKFTAPGSIPVETIGPGVQRWLESRAGSFVLCLLTS